MLPHGELAKIWQLADKDLSSAVLPPNETLQQHLPPALPDKHKHCVETRALHGPFYDGPLFSTIAGVPEKCPLALTGHFPSLVRRFPHGAFP